VAPEPMAAAGGREAPRVWPAAVGGRRPGPVAAAGGRGGAPTGGGCPTAMVAPGGAAAPPGVGAPPGDAAGGGEERTCAQEVVERGGKQW
jgi:hypothetical protein